MTSSVTEKNHIQTFREIRLFLSELQSNPILTLFSLGMNAAKVIQFRVINDVTTRQAVGVTSSKQQVNTLQLEYREVFLWDFIYLSAIMLKSSTKTSNSSHKAVMQVTSTAIYLRLCLF